MDPELERVLEGLKEAAEFAKSYRFEMTEDYLALIARVEAMPQFTSRAAPDVLCPGRRAFCERPVLWSSAEARQ